MDPQESNVQEIVSEESISKKKMPKSTKIAISIMVIVLMGICVSFVARQNSIKQYGQDYTYVKVLMLGEAIELAGMADNYTQVWNRAINNRFMNFNDELKKQYQKYESDGTNTKRKDAKDNIISKLRDLSNPPTKYEKAYAGLMDLYNEYTRLYDLGTNPSGSYLTYSAAATKTTQDFLNKTDALKLVEPVK